MGEAVVYVWSVLYDFGYSVSQTMIQNNELVILLAGEPAGVLQRHGDVITFAYDSQYAQDYDATPLSTAIPIDQRFHSGEHIAAWIDGLLPDNERVRFLWGREFGVDERSPFNLLGTKVGHDCAGAVQFCHPADLDDLLQRGRARHLVREEDIADHLRELAEDSACWHRRGALGGRFSLGGAQAKFALHQDEHSQWWQPEKDMPTTHIFKPSIQGLEDQDLIEHLTMEIACRLGLATARSKVAVFGDQRAIVVERCDRQHTDTGVARLHQEDFCQALGVRPQMKYQRWGGPSPVQIADHLWEWSSNPAKDVERFLDAVFYNWLIVGPDAHAKNYSILLRGDEVTLSPLYDVCSYLPWLSDEQAIEGEPLSMSVGDGFKVGDADAAHIWEGAAVRMDLDPGAFCNRAIAMAEDLEKAVADSVAALPAAIGRTSRVDSLLAWAAKRSFRCLEIFVR